MIKKLFSLVLFICVAVGAKSQSTVVEITWTSADYTTYQGLMVMYPNNMGDFVVKFHNPSVGWVWVHQNAMLTNEYDYYGNCTSYITCSYPTVNPSYVPYAADNFICYPNGQMYTQDAAGTWSTMIVANPIQPAYWQSKLREYGLL